MTESKEKEFSFQCPEAIKAAVIDTMKIGLFSLDLDPHPNTASCIPDVINDIVALAKVILSHSTFHGSVGGVLSVVLTDYQYHPNEYYWTYDRVVCKGLHSYYAYCTSKDTKNLTVHGTIDISYDKDERSKRWCETVIQDFLSRVVYFMELHYKWDYARGCLVRRSTPLKAQCALDYTLNHQLDKDIPVETSGPIQVEHTVKKDDVLHVITPLTTLPLPDINFLESLPKIIIENKMINIGETFKNHDYKAVLDSIVKYLGLEHLVIGPLSVSYVHRGINVSEIWGRVDFRDGNLAVICSIQTLYTVRIEVNPASFTTSNVSDIAVMMAALTLLSGINRRVIAMRECDLYHTTVI